MNKRKKRAKKARGYLKIWFVVLPALGIVGALAIAAFWDTSAQGYLIGYAIVLFRSLSAPV